MINYYQSVLKNYANFDGRARRSEYWYFALANFLIILGLEILGFVVAFALESKVLTLIFGILVIGYLLATIIPNISVLVRRLHDVGKSGWWYFISFVPLIGGIWLLVLICTDSQPGSNEYGINPKTGEVDLINTIN